MTTRPYGFAKREVLSRDQQEVLRRLIARHGAAAMAAAFKTGRETLPLAASGSPLLPETRDRIQAALAAYLARQA